MERSACDGFPLSFLTEPPFDCQLNHVELTTYLKTVHKILFLFLVSLCFKSKAESPNMADSHLRMSVIPRVKFHKSPTLNFLDLLLQIQVGKNSLSKVLRKSFSISQFQ
jgi:hypothetical protein